MGLERPSWARESRMGWSSPTVSLEKGEVRAGRGRGEPTEEEGRTLVGRKRSSRCPKADDIVRRQKKGGQDTG